MSLLSDPRLHGDTPRQLRLWRFFLLAGIGIALSSVPLLALELPLPAGAVETARERQPFSTEKTPVSPWISGEMEAVTTEGVILRRAWRIPSTSLTPLQALAPVRASLEEQGYRIIFECADRDCGGFDFRFALSMLPEPDMHVDLGDYHYLAAERPSGDDFERVSLVASRSGTAGFLHLTQITPGKAPTPRTISVTPSAEPAPEATPPSATPFAAKLLGTGRAVLEDLEFDIGSAELGGDDYASLEALATFLKARPELRIVLVGHTDSEGDLEANIALSRRRAAAAAGALVALYGVDVARVTSEGVGYLAPRASNETAEGREANRRVEAVLVGHLDASQ